MDTGNAITTHAAQNGFYEPIEIYRNGAVLSGREGSSTKIFNRVTNKELENKETVWRLVSINYNNGILIITIDGIQILNIPNFNFKPKMISIGAIYNQPSQGYPRAIKNVNTIGINLPPPPDADNSANEDSEAQIDSTTTIAAGSGLEAIDEGNGIGWRLKGRDPNKYGNIGVNAVDLSHSTHVSTTNGATGVNSTALGHNTASSGDYSTATGSKTEASGNYATSLGVRTKASGALSFSMGMDSEASGYISTAIGKSAFFRAKGRNSIAIGSKYVQMRRNFVSKAIGHDNFFNALKAIIQSH